MLNVSCAVIIDGDGQVLVAQRSHSMPQPLKWEFPGGKVEAEETAEQALHREITEELDVSIEIISRLQESIYSYPTKQICLIPFLCRITKGEICLKDHLAFAWHKPAEILQLDLAEADIPIVWEIMGKAGR